MVTLRAFGALDLRDASGAPLGSVLAQTKRAALLAYLLLSRPGELHRRDTLLALFWPELDQDHGRGALNQALTFLRRELGEDVLVVRGAEEVGVDPGRVRCDVLMLREALRREDWGGALELYRGDPLEGLHVKGAPEFLDWVDRERTRLREAAAGAAWRWAHQLLGEGKPVEAERKAQRALELVATDESPVRAFIEALAAVGDRGAALRFYEKFKTVLERELGVEPARETRALVQAVRNEELGAEAGVGVGEGLPGRMAEHGLPGAEVAGGADLAAAAESAEQRTADTVREEGVRRRIPRWRPWTAAAGVLVLILGIAGAWALRPWGPAPPGPHVREPVVVLPFEVQGGDGTLEPMGIQVADRIAAAIEGAKLARVVAYRPEGRSRPFTERVGRRAVRETGAGTVVTGVIAYWGGWLEVRANIVRGSDLKTLWTLGPERGPASDAAPALDVIRERVLGAVGWYMMPTMEGQTHPGIYQPPASLEVLRLAQKGADLFAAARYAEAIPLYREAFERDTTWLGAATVLATTYGNAGLRRERDSVRTFLEARRARLHPGDALMNDRGLATDASPEREVEASRALFEMDSSEAYTVLWSLVRARRPAEALEYLPLRDTTVAWQREWQAWVRFAGLAYHMLGQFEEELAAARDGKTRVPLYFQHWLREVSALAALGRLDDVEGIILESHALESVQAPVQLQWTAALELSRHGRPEEARVYAERVLAGLQRWPDSLRATATARTTRLGALRILGRHAEVVQGYDEEAGRVEARGVSGLGVRILAMRDRIRLGDTVGALALADSARTRPLSEFSGAGWNEEGEPLYYGSHILSLLGRGDEAVLMLRDALNHGYRLGPDEPLEWFWAPIEDYLPFQELMRVR